MTSGAHASDFTSVGALPLVIVSGDQAAVTLAFTPAATGARSGRLSIVSNDPTLGVHAPDMQRHIMGEDLKIGANLTWGPCFDYQKQFFTGAVSDVSKYPYLLRYDVEVSGFGSHQSGHLCLLRLKDQMYPGGESKHHWPTLGLNTLKWAKKQGAVVGPAHSGWGLEVGSAELPNYTVPPFKGIGANEYIVDVTHKVPGPDGELVPAVDNAIANLLQWFCDGRPLDVRQNNHAWFRHGRIVWRKQKAESRKQEAAITFHLSGFCFLISAF